MTHQQLLKEFAVEQRGKAIADIASRKDPISLDEAIRIIDRIVADYLDLKEQLVLLRA